MSRRWNYRSGKNAHKLAAAYLRQFVGCKRRHWFVALRRSQPTFPNESRRRCEIQAFCSPVVHRTFILMSADRRRAGRTRRVDRGFLRPHQALGTDSSYLLLLVQFRRFLLFEEPELISNVFYWHKFELSTNSSLNDIKKKKSWPPFQHKLFKGFANQVSKTTLALLLAPWSNLHCRKVVQTSRVVSSSPTPLLSRKGNVSLPQSLYY